MRSGTPASGTPVVSKSILKYRPSYNPTGWTAAAARVGRVSKQAVVAAPQVVEEVDVDVSFVDVDVDVSVVDVDVSFVDVDGSGVDVDLSFVDAGFALGDAAAVARTMPKKTVTVWRYMIQDLKLCRIEAQQKVNVLKECV